MLKCFNIKYMNQSFSFIILVLLGIITSIDISIHSAEKLFNQNTPIILNLNSPDTLNKQSNVDLICVIDISGSMQGEKIELVKESLLTLSKMMTASDRLGVVLFSNQASIYFPLSEMTPMNKKIVEEKMATITANGGTSILEGLKLAIELLAKELNPKNTPGIILLSDGLDNNLNENDLTNGLREITRDMKIPFTLHTFGYGNDHDPKSMNRLANLRDGSFYYVEEMNKVKEYFVNVFGGFMSVISSNALLLIDSNYPIKKVFGIDQLYQSVLNELYFETTILQFIGGKEYTFVLEMEIPENLVIGADLLTVTFNYTGLDGKKYTQVDKMRLVENKPFNKIVRERLEIANEEYIRAETYDKIQEAVNEREQGKIEEAKEILKNMENWLKSNYRGQKNFINDVRESTQSIDEYDSRGRAYMTSTISESQMKRGGSQMLYSNRNQKMLISMLQ